MLTNYDWLRLDNSAKLYPLINYKDNQNLFRMSAELTEEVDAEVLQQALDITMPRFPSFAVRLMKGIFWYYFEANRARPMVVAESDILMEHITPYNCNGFCFRVMYYHNRVTLEVYHVICDGAGAIEFLKSLLYSYLTLRGNNIDVEGKVLTVNTPINPRELEDSFIHNYKPVKLKEGKFGKLAGKDTAYSVRGIPFSTKYGKGVVSCDLSASKLHAFCKEHGYTITEYLGGLFMYSIYMTKGRYERDPNKIILFLPINLRKVYESVTLRNFTLFARVGVDINVQDIPLEVFIQAVKEGLANALLRENLDSSISTAVLAEKTPAIRVLPLFIKKLAFAISNIHKQKNPTKTATFSNMGVVSLPESMRPFIRKLAFMVHTYSAVPQSLTVITAYDVMTISMSRSIMDTDIETFFMRHLASEGLDLLVSSNYWEVDNAL